jgi:hypothetical protein
MTANSRRSIAVALELIRSPGLPGDQPMVARLARFESKNGLI